MLLLTRLLAEVFEVETDLGSADEALVAGVAMNEGKKLMYLGECYFRCCKCERALSNRVDGSEEERVNSLVGEIKTATVFFFNTYLSEYDIEESKECISGPARAILPILIRIIGKIALQDKLQQADAVAFLGQLHSVSESEDLWSGVVFALLKAFRSKRRTSLELFPEIRVFRALCLEPSIVAIIMNMEAWMSTSLMNRAISSLLGAP
jgi:hypothetical protein